MFGFGRRKVKIVDPEQYNVVNHIAKSQNIPIEEVLWVMIEFGGQLLCMSQENKKLAKSLNKGFGHLHEYENWERIAKESYKLWKAGEHPPDKKEK